MTICPTHGIFQASSDAASFRKGFRHGLFWGTSPPADHGCLHHILLQASVHVLPTDSELEGRTWVLIAAHWPPSLHSAPVPGTTKAAEHRWYAESSCPLEPREGRCGHWSFCTLCQRHVRWNTVPNRGEKLYLLGSGWGVERQTISHTHFLCPWRTKLHRSKLVRLGSSSRSICAAQIWCA